MPVEGPGLVQAVNWTARTFIPEGRVPRVLVFGNALRTPGSGLVVTLTPIFFVENAGLSGTQLGLGLTIATSLALLGAVPTGRLIDALGPRGLAAGGTAGQGLVLMSYPFATNFTAFIVVVSLSSFLEVTAGAARGSVIGNAVDPARRVVTRAALRSVSNVGVSLGAGLAALALAWGEWPAYVSAYAVAGLLYVLGASTYALIPAVPPSVREEGESAWPALRDKPYLLVTLLSAGVAFHQGLFVVALPIWIVSSTEAPPALFPVLVIVNTVLVVLFQVPVSRRVTDTRTAARAQRTAGLGVLVACLTYSAAGAVAAWIAIALLVAGSAVHAVAETLQESGAWGLSYDLAPANAHGQYQGLFGGAQDLSVALSPAISLWLLESIGGSGWILLAAAVAASGFALPSVVRRASQQIALRPAPNL